MCRYRVSLFQARGLVQRCRNLVWHDQALSESDAIQLLNALEDMVTNRDRRLRRRWLKKWNRRFGAEFSRGE